MNPESKIKQNDAGSIAATVEQEWLAIGLTAEAWDQMKQIGEIEEKLLAAGRTIEDINAEWETKSPEQILQEYADLPDLNALPDVEPLFTTTDWCTVYFGMFLTKPEPTLIFHTDLLLRDGATRRYEQSALVLGDSKKLSDHLLSLSVGQPIEVCLQIGLGENQECRLIDLRKSPLQIHEEPLIDADCVNRLEPRFSR
jgi:hypothetical protein